MLIFPTDPGIVVIVGLNLRKRRLIVFMEAKVAEMEMRGLALSEFFIGLIGHGTCSYRHRQYSM